LSTLDSGDKLLTTQFKDHFTQYKKEPYDTMQDFNVG